MNSVYATKDRPFHAYSEMYEGLEAVMRLQAVKRWHMIDTTRQQTLAEHSANVALLAYYIAQTAPGIYWGNPDKIAALALTHDLGEVFLGDIPTHTKKALDIVGAVAAAEAEVLLDVFSQEHDYKHTTLIKMCDLADGIRFVRIHGVDHTAKHAQSGLEDQLESLFNKIIGQGCPDVVSEHLRKNIQFYAYEMS